MGNTSGMANDRYGTVLTFPSGKAAPGSYDTLADELADIEKALAAAATRLLQLSQNLDQHLQHGHLDQLNDPFAVTADVGDQIDHASQAATLAADHARVAINMWRSGWGRKQTD